MANPRAENERRFWGYGFAILLSALGHVALVYLALFVLPKYFKPDRRVPPSYTVKIVDNLPAGDLGSHLPRLSQKAQDKPPAQTKPAPPEPEKPKPETRIEPPLESDQDKTALALNTRSTPKAEPPTVSPTPTPPPEPRPTATPTPAPPEPTPFATPAPKPSRVRAPAPVPTKALKARPKKATPEPSALIVKGDSSAAIRDKLQKIREQLLAQHLASAKKASPAPSTAADEEDEEEPAATPDKSSGGGPVAAKVATEGRGYGVGPGSGSSGIQQNLDFLLYYRSVQERVKKAWSFSGANNELTTTVTFAIGPDGALTGLKITQSSKDDAYDDSVARAIRRAAPFPAPPEKYRELFGQGIEATFKLGELNS